MQSHQKRESRCNRESKCDVQERKYKEKSINLGNTSILEDGKKKGSIKKDREGNLKIK